MSKWVYQADGFSPDEESCVLHETVFHNGNGYIGCLLYTSDAADEL